MKAEKKGDFYVLNGSKMWITNSYEAGVFLVFANSDPSKGYKGITCFIVEKDMGIKIAKKEQKVCIHHLMSSWVSGHHLLVNCRSMTLKYRPRMYSGK
jgi:alkylation response protein AidB-like acyl-CoA dehydrogenase